MRVVFWAINLWAFLSIYLTLCVWFPGFSVGIPGLFWLLLESRRTYWKGKWEEMSMDWVDELLRVGD